MNRSRIIAFVFLCVALVQLALPASRIWLYEKTLQQGHAFKFRTRPVDPYDAFRGRYVSLSFDAGSAAWNGTEPLPWNAEIFVRVETGPDGFAKFGEATLSPPDGSDYLKVRSLYGSSGRSTGVEIPFDRFYMEETIAPEAEQVYREHNFRSSPRDAYSIVRIHKGRGVIEQVFIGDKTLAEAARAALTQGGK